MNEVTPIHTRAHTHCTWQVPNVTSARLGKLRGYTEPAPATCVLLVLDCESLVMTAIGVLSPVAHDVRPPQEADSPARQAWGKRWM